MNIVFWMIPFCDWDAINSRRCDLIDKCVSGEATDEESRECLALQDFAENYASWKTDHSLLIANFTLSENLRKLRALKQAMRP